MGRWDKDSETKDETRSQLEAVLHQHFDELRNKEFGRWFIKLCQEEKISIDIRNMEYRESLFRSAKLFHLSPKELHLIAEHLITINGECE